MDHHRPLPLTAKIVLCVLAALLPACMSRFSLRPELPTSPEFQLETPKETVQPLSKEDLALLEGSNDGVYRLGAGDKVRVTVLGRDEVSGSYVIGPDGMISVPMLGEVALRDLTREAAQAELDARFREYFSEPHVTVGVEEYLSNQITVLGRVEHYGVQQFVEPPTLIQVLANAGALPILDKQATLTRCAIIRGQDKVIWIDLKALLSGELAYNLPMRRGDIVFVPDSADTSVFVLGAVPKPGSYRLTPDMTALDLLAQAGGPTDNAAPEKIGIYRAGATKPELITFDALIDPSRSLNYALEDGDVIYVPNSRLAGLGYLLRQISPAVSVLTLGLAASAAIGSSNKD